MIINSISVNNYKTLSLNNFSFKKYNTIIGPNGAGKSNLVSFYKFIGDILEDDLETAIARQGGVSNILNFNSNDNKLDLEIVFNKNFNKYDKINSEQPIKIKYKMELLFSKKTPSSIDEYLSIKQIKLDNENISSEDRNKILEELNNIISTTYDTELNKIQEHGIEIYDIIIQRNDENLKIETNHPNSDNSKFKTYIKRLEDFLYRKLDNFTNLILTNYNVYSKEEIAKIRTYDFDTKAPKNYTSKQTEKYLVKNGENLVNRLDFLFIDEKKKNRFLRLYKSFLPYIKDAKIRRTTSNSYSLYINETYNDKYTPPDLISDGTIGIIGIILALYFEESDIALIEEPEKYIHPQIIRKIANSIDDASLYKQIIITTHSTELLKHTNKENIIFVLRAKDGYSKFMYPNDNENIRDFMENDLQLEDLFVNDFLGVA